MNRPAFPSKFSLFLSNAALLQQHFAVVPLLYGSLGLEYRAGISLGADDIDILIPDVFITGRWPEFRAFLEQNGFTLADEHEHEFEKDGVTYAYAGIGGLGSFAGFPLSEVGTAEAEGVRFLLLSLEQYLKVYTASSRDGYRIHVREKKDLDKITLLKKLLEEKQ